MIRDTVGVIGMAGIWVSRDGWLVAERFSSKYVLSVFPSRTWIIILQKGISWSILYVGTAGRIANSYFTLLENSRLGAVLKTTDNGAHASEWSCKFSTILQFLVTLIYSIVRWLIEFSA